MLFYFLCLETFNDALLSVRVSCGNGTDSLTKKIKTTGKEKLQEKVCYFKMINLQKKSMLSLLGSS